MKKIEFFVSDEKLKLVDKIRKKEQFTRAELMRRALDGYLKELDKELKANKLNLSITRLFENRPLHKLVFFIEALKTGPFSIVGAITNFSLLITLSLAIFIYKERPTVKHIFGIVLSFIALFLFKL